MDKLKILERIEKGEITPDEGAKLIAESSSTDQSRKSKNGLLDEMQILEKIEKGDMTIEDGINELHGNIDSQKPKVSVNQYSKKQNKTSSITEDELQKWRNWWTIPVFVGFLIVLLSGLWMNSAYENSGVGFWYLLSWVPLLIGISTMAFSWPSPNRTWLHVRIKQKSGEKPTRIAVSIPMPLQIISWGFKIAKKYVTDDTLDRIDETAVDEMIDEIERSAANGTPFYVEVDEGDGQRVEIYFG